MQTYGPTIPRTMALRHWDARLFVSEHLWRDAAYALGESTNGWREITTDTERDALAGLFGDMPQYPGEYVVRPSDAQHFDRIRADEDAPQDTTARHACPDCGEPIEQHPSGWWSHVGLPHGCWRVSLDGPDNGDDDGDDAPQGPQDCPRAVEASR